MRAFRLVFGVVVCLAGGLAAIAIGPAPASAKVTCGGLSKPPCGHKKAIYHGKMNWKCPPGSTFNLGTRACWANCPAGYKRTLKSVKGPKACVLQRSTRKTRASKSAPKCAKGQFVFNIRNNPGCYSCPPGFIYNFALARGTAKVCMRVGRLVEPAFKGRACGSAALLKGACWKCPKGYRIDVDKPDRKNACESTEEKHLPTKFVQNATKCPDGRFFDLINGGTCWSCPDYYERTAHSVKSAKACANIGLEWQTPPYREPGLFGLDGAVDVAVDILTKHRDDIDAMIDGIAEAMTAMGETVPKTFRNDEWNVLTEAPEESAALNGLMFVRMVYAIAGGPATEADTRLAEAFEAYIPERRAYSAENALQAYKAWKAWSDRERAKKKNMSVLFDYGVVPIDFAQVIADEAANQPPSPTAIAGYLGVGGAFEGLRQVGDRKIMERKRAFKRIMKNLLVKANDAADDADDALHTAKDLFQGRRLGRDTTRKGVKNTIRSLRQSRKAKLLKRAAQVGRKAYKVGKAARSILAVSGPGAIVAAAEIIAEVSITQVIKISQAEKKLVAAVRLARQRVNLGREIDRANLGPIRRYWAFATWPTRYPAPKRVIEAVKFGGVTGNPIQHTQTVSLPTNKPAKPKRSPYVPAYYDTGKETGFPIGNVRLPARKIFEKADLSRALDAKRGLRIRLNDSKCLGVERARDRSQLIAAVLVPCESAPAFRQAGDGPLVLAEDTDVQMVIADPAGKDGSAVVLAHKSVNVGAVYAAQAGGRGAFGAAKSPFGAAKGGFGGGMRGKAMVPWVPATMAPWGRLGYGRYCLAAQRDGTLAVARACNANDRAQQWSLWQMPR